MSSLRYASRYRCDFCGVIADIPPREDDLIQVPPGPPGWLLAYPSPYDRTEIRFWAETIDGNRFGDICADCGALPVTVLKTMLERRLTPSPE